MFGLLGPNGAGKSTLMQILATVLPPTSGEVRIGDYRIGKDDQHIRRLLGYLPQTFGLYAKLTGEEFLNYIAVLKGVHDVGARRLIVKQLLDKVNLADKAKQKIKSYSGGMKQRIGIAQALIGDPQVIIVDEPTAGLDPEERIRFRNLLEELSLERIVLLSTHIVADIETSCSRLAVLNKGKVSFQGTPDEMIAKVESKVWSGTVREDEVYLYKLNGKVVSRRKTSGGYELRLVSETMPFPGAERATAGLEDAYIYLAGSDAHA